MRDETTDARMTSKAQQAPRRQGDPIPAVRLSGKAQSAEADKAAVVYDFGASYPVGEVRLNPAFYPAEGGAADISFSLNGKEWNDAPEGHSGGLPVRYARIASGTAEAAAAGLFSAGEASSSPADNDTDGTDGALFLAGRGLAAEPADRWTRMFHRHKDWSGADGIYSIPLDGNEAPGSAASGRTLMLFGDTFIGGVDPQTGARLSPTVMINNSMAILEGDRPDPEAVRFLWNDRGDEPGSAIVPSTAKALGEKGTYYWLQDGTSVEGEFHCFPLIIGPNPDGPEGFQFAVHGITLVSAPMGPDGPQLERQQQTDTPLYFKSAGGLTTYFGAAVMPHTEEAGVPAPDGHVYIYGLQYDGVHKLVAARVPAGTFADFGSWTFWNGAEWTDRKEDCVPIAPEVSCELSVSPMTGGFLDGKYVIAFQRGGTTGNEVAMYAGDSPVGPFGPCVPLHYCAESDAGMDIYTYNAKGHPHLSAPGELLVSYNVNSTSMDAHMDHGDIYRPRFIAIRQIT